MTYNGVGLKRQPLSAISPRAIAPIYLDDIEERIVRSLGEKPRSSISEVAKDVSINRSTASKYLYVLKAKRKADFHQVGPVKLWCLEGS